MSKQNWATVTKPSPGVRDGEMKISHFFEGDIVTGNLAASAIKHGWAEEGEGDPPVFVDGQQKDQMSVNIEDAGAKIAIAMKDKTVLQKEVGDLNKKIADQEVVIEKLKTDLTTALTEVSSLNELSAQQSQVTAQALDDLKAQLKAADEALKTVTHESETEKDFSAALIDLVRNAGDMDAALDTFLQDRGRDDLLPLTASAKTMAGKLAPKNTKK